MDHQKISELAHTYDNPSRQIRCSTPVQLEIGAFCFSRNKNMTVTIQQALLEFLIREGHEWSDADMAAIIEGGEPGGAHG